MMTKPMATKYLLRDLRYATLFPKRYGMPPAVPQDRDARVEWWGAVSRSMERTTHEIYGSDCRWYVVLFKDGRKELAYLKCRRRHGKFSGRIPPLYRGWLFPVRVRHMWYAWVKSIRKAF